MACEHVRVPTALRFAFALSMIVLVSASVSTTALADTIEWKGYTWQSVNKTLSVQNDVLYTEYYAAAEPNALIGETTIGRDILIEAAFLQGGNSYGVRMSLYGLLDFGGAQHYTALEIGTMPSGYGYSNYGARYYHDANGTGQGMVAQQFSDQYPVVNSTTPVKVGMHLKASGWFDLYINDALVWSTERDIRLAGNTHLMDSVRAIHLNYGSSGYTDFKITENNSPVPEPSTLMMFGSAALGSLGYLRIRRRKGKKEIKA